MKQKSSISAPKKGLNKDTHHSQLTNIEYVFASNVDTTNEQGDSLNIQFEPSNYYAVNFPAGYKVIGFRVSGNRTYYWLTSIDENEDSEHYKRSSIGYVENTVLETYNEDSETTCDSCNSKNILETPLEQIIQVPSLTYVELIHDRCISLSDIEEKGLNFNINFPIKKIEVKRETTGTKFYWNDFRNPPRHLDITNIEESLEKGVADYLHIDEVSCDDDIVTDCLLVDNLLIFPKHNRMVIEAAEEQIGGNLKKGTYEFYAAYCDLYGNEATEYCTPTNPISIFDENNNILSQTEIDSYTNYAIKLKLKNLDTKNFKYYKVAVVERNNVSNTQSVFVVGIYPTTDDVVVYTHSGSSDDDIHIYRGNVSIKKRMDFYQLKAQKPNYKRAKGTMVSGKKLWHFGVEAEEELNLQPVVNLFSSLTKWQTSAAKEDLYKSAVATSKYKGFMRNEVQPFAIRFHFADGGYTANFPFIARPKNDNDKIVVTDKNFQSIDKNGTKCTTNNRNERWEIFNTATKDEGYCVDLENDENAITSIEEVVKTCTIENVFEIPAGTKIIETEEEYYDLESYINAGNEVDGISEYLDDEYPGDCDPNFSTACGTAELEDEVIKIGEVQEETKIAIEKAETDYVKSVPPENCNQFKRNTETGDFIPLDRMNPFISCGRVVYQRDGSFNNENCAYATELPNQTNPSQALSSVYFNVYGANISSDLYKESGNYEVAPSTVTTNFHNKLHVNAQFFKIAKNNRDKIVFEITKMASVCSNIDEGIDYSNDLRYTIYDKCGTGRVVLGGGLVDDIHLSGHLEILNISTFPNTFYIAIDTPIIPKVITDCTYNQSIVFINPPLQCCVGIYQRDVEYSGYKVSWDKVILSKTQTWKSTCTFKIPKVNSCDPVAFQKGEFAYWQSTEIYPDNNELYNSSAIKIKPEDLNRLSPEDKTRFLGYYTNGVDSNGNYIWKNEVKEVTGDLSPITDFTCREIRHFKFPDNTVAPYIIDNEAFQKNADSIIFPLGIFLDTNVVNTMLDVAVNNGLITKKQRSKISSYEILRGDNSIHKSVIANGIAFDMYNYTKGVDTIHYPNFPFNDLGYNKFSTKTLDGPLIDHPYQSNRNHLFSFLSPDIFLTYPAIPTELTFQGYLFGNSETSFADVDKHPGWTVLGDKSRRTAEQLAFAEFALEYAIGAAEILKMNYTTAGFSNTVTWGAVAAAALYATANAIGSFIKIGKYRYDWLKIFRDLGPIDNFGSFQTSVGKYNRFLKTEQYSSDYLRALSIRKYIKDGEFQIVDEDNGKQIKVNNWLRETSAFLSVGEDFQLSYSNTYINYDNNKVNSLSSNFVASEVGCETKNRHTRNVASPYFSLKNYVPDQWDAIDSIKWLTTNYIYNLNESNDCKTTLGGTVCISRFSWRRKVPMFRKTAIGLPDKLPFTYSKYDNIGYPSYYCDYEVGDTWTTSGVPFPDIKSKTKFDCERGRTDFYYKPPSKFYLFVHGVTDFLVESEINCNFRYGKAEPRDWFYPQQQNLTDWLQETKVPMSEPNTFYYNTAYSDSVSDTPHKKLTRDYNREIWEKRRKTANGVIISGRDTNERSLVDPYLIYKPADYVEFGSDNGELIDLRSIESEQFFARFERNLELHNAIDNLAERITPQNKDLGTGFLSQRVIDYKTTDLGFAGTQNTDFVSTPYGHFWVDAKRGRIFKTDQNGGNLEIISEAVNGQPTGMKNWFREHLPMKILKYLPDLDVDNKFKGIGYNIWYDDRKARVFITKRDYVIKESVVMSAFEWNSETNQLFYKNKEVFFDNVDVFKDVSFTISFKATEGMWNSYFTFYPDYSPQFNGYFQTGYNWGESEGTLWNHYLNNKSFLVFQGKFNPMQIEFPIANENVNKMLNSVTIDVEARRYQNEWDYAVHKDVGFTNMYIYNSTNNSGMLNLFAQKSLTDNRNYPKTNADNSQDILFTSNEGKHSVNYFFNRVVNQDNNVPIFLKDKNDIFKTINPKAVKFSGKKVLERMKGDTFLINLSNTKESRFNLIFEKTINDETAWQQ